MAKPLHSLRGAIDAKCRECGGTEGGNRHWRQHVAACSVTGCALWCVRPLPEYGPDWLMTRDADRLPMGWRAQSLDTAMAFIRDALAVAPPALGGISTTAPDLVPECQGNTDALQDAFPEPGTKGKGRD